MTKIYLQIINNMFDCILFFEETLSDFKKNFKELSQKVSESKLLELWQVAENCTK